MKNTLLLCFAFCLSNEYSFAQASFSTIDSININNINASVLVHGDMWWNGNGSNYLHKCMYPNGSQKNISFAGALWMSAYDAGNQLHIAAQTYRQDGNDYWPGPLDASDTLTYATSYAWAKIWKVNLTDIDTFLTSPTHTTTNTPPSILTWPGKGNVNAQGNGGSPLTIITDMAPFVDLNGNGIYEPLLGEYPLIKGNQTLWWVFSDNGPVHSQTNGKPLGVEVHAMSYAFKRGSLIDNVVYYEYDMINKSAHNYINSRIGIWNDVEIGYALDDYIGFDSTLRMGIAYNGTNCDGCSAGNPTNSYGLNPPQCALTMIVLPGDVGTNYVPAGSFTTYENDFSILGNPSNDTQYNNYMRSKVSNGQSIASVYLNDTLPYPCGHHDSTEVINYVYPGDPSDTAAWSECACHLNAFDARFILSSNDFSFNSGTTQKFVFAMIVADSAGGCPATNFDKIKILADTAWVNYHQHASSVKNIVTNNALNIYPNPAHNQINIETSGITTGEETITFYNIIGQKLNVNITRLANERVADISNLPNGIYLVAYNNGTIQKTVKVIKE